MRVAPSPSSAKGEVRLQPSYFTSSLYVNPFREDVSRLIEGFRTQYLQLRPTQPFSLFKSIWNAQGWKWVHLRVFDARAREAFLKVSVRVFLERIVATESPMTRVVALFGLYTFFSTQPESPAPPIYAIKHVPIPIDHYNSLMMLPNALNTEELQLLQPRTSYILHNLVERQIFFILPSSELYPENPRDVPREVFYQASQEEQSASSSAAELPKRKGRPSRREKMQKAKDALKNLDKWLDNTNYTYPSSDTPSSVPTTTHILLSHPPTTTRLDYQIQKSHLLNHLTSETSVDGRQFLKRANDAVVSRLLKIDQMASEKGLEVGSEGGERTGLERVERAASELEEEDNTNVPRGGILGLLEGGGLIAPNMVDADADGQRRSEAPRP